MDRSAEVCGSSIPRLMFLSSCLISLNDGFDAVASYRIARRTIERNKNAQSEKWGGPNYYSVKRFPVYARVLILLPYFRIYFTRVHTFHSAPYGRQCLDLLLHRITFSKLCLLNYVYFMKSCVTVSSLLILPR